jgi:hypothetical protein
VTLAFLLGIANLVGFILSRRIITWLKARIAYPRTGYVGLFGVVAATHHSKPGERREIDSLGGGFPPLVLDDEPGAAGRLPQPDVMRQRELRNPHFVMIFLSVFILHCVAKYIPSQLFSALAGVAYAAGVSVVAQIYLRRSWSILYGLLFGVFYYGLLAFRGPGRNSLGAFLLGTSFSLISVGALSLTRYLQTYPHVESRRK